MGFWSYLVVVVGSVYGEGGRDGLSKDDGALLPLLHDYLGRGLAHHVHHVKRAFDLKRALKVRRSHRVSIVVELVRSLQMDVKIMGGTSLES